MKPLTVAQVMGFRGAMVPPTRRKYDVDAAPSAEQKRMAKTKAATRRAIDEHKERLALQREWEL